MDVKSVLDSKGRRVMTARPRATIATIAHRFRQERIGALVITDDDEKTILGIVSERDVVHGLSNHGAELLAMRVEPDHDPEVATCSPGDKLKTVMAQMTRLRARHIPAVENGVLCGLISIGDVVKHRLDDLEMFAPDDRGDFMQVRFWSYLKRRCIDACRVTFRHAEDTESLETGFSGEGGSEGQTKLDREVDPQLAPEALAMMSEAVKQLPQNLRHVFLLRHYVGMKIGPDSLADDDGGELTIAAQFGRTGRTIRNWLHEASRLLAEFQEKHDDGK